MQISHLKTFLAVRKTGSFSAAAQAVNLSHSAVSVQMKLLEQAVGAPLFVRDRRPAVLTELGRELVQRAEEIVRRVDALEMLSVRDSTSGAIRIGFIPTTLQTVLPVLLSGLQQEFPDLQVYVRSALSAELAEATGRGEIDFAFLTAPMVPDPDTLSQEIGEEPLFVIAAKSLDKAKNSAVLLRRERYIAFSRKTWLGRQVDVSLDEMGIRTEPAIELDSIDAIENLVSKGFGVSVVPQRLFAPPLAERVRCYPFTGRYATRRLILVSRRDAQRSTVRSRIIALLARRG